MALQTGNWGKRNPMSGVIILFITGRVPHLYNLVSLKQVSSQLVVQDVDLAVLSLKVKIPAWPAKWCFLHMFLRRSTPKLLVAWFQIDYIDSRHYYLTIFYAKKNMGEKTRIFPQPTRQASHPAWAAERRTWAMPITWRPSSSRPWTGQAVLGGWDPSGWKSG